MYNYITNPDTGKKVSIYSKLGKDIITNYFLYNKYGGAAAPPASAAGAAATPTELVAGQEMTIEQIRAATLDRDVEICGEIRNGKFIYHNTGVNDETENRGLCQLPRSYPEGEWHTHAVSHRFYPSNEDFHKVMYDRNRISMIFTPYGYWTIDCPGPKIPKERAKRADKNLKITQTNDRFATIHTVGGTGYTPNPDIDYNYYVDKANQIFQNIYQVRCNITWTYY